ncbi:hypothetical protein ABFS82_04G154100 [Erythranthe guttata]
MHGTGNLINHLQLQCKKYPYRLVDDKQKTLVYGNDASSITLKFVSYSYEECRLKLVEMVILDELPFKIVEGEGFKRYSACLQPRFTLPSRITIARDCMKLYFDEKNKLRSLIKFERVCLTTDTWTSIQNINYMCLTAHWIDKEWRLQKRILSFCAISDHKGKTIGKMIESCLLDWGIDKILTITVENASSNDGAIKYVRKNTRGWKTTILDHEFLHVRCCAHILNLIVKDGLKEQNESILKIRNGVRYVRSSPARLKTFTKCANVEKIESKSSVCLDIETRWNSTYLMLEAATKFEKAIERLKEDDSNYKIYFKLGDKDDEDNDRDQLIGGEQTSEKRKAKDSKYIGPPNEDDWTVARSFIKFLKLFYDVTKQFSGSLHVTSNLFLQEIVVVHAKLKYLSRHNDPKVSLMGLKMQEKFVKYWESFDKLNLFVYVGTVLDPRYKLRFVTFCLNQVYEDDSAMSSLMEDEVRKVLTRLYEYYKQRTPGQNSENVTSSSSQALFDVMDIDDGLGTGKYLASQFAKQLEKNECVKSKSELARYLEESCEKDVESFDLLRWWKENSIRFPIISQIARDILAIPVSTVASESAFSTSGRILDPYRSSLNPEMVEALVCCQSWLRSKPTTIDILELMREVSITDVENYNELLKEFQSSGISSTTTH